jgi:hypothetical protein
MQPVPRADGRRTVETSIGLGGDVRLAPGGRVTEDELAAVPPRATLRLRGVGWGRAAQDSIRAHPHQYRDRQIMEQEGQAGAVIARVGHDQDLRVTGLPVPSGDQIGHDLAQLGGGDRGGVVARGQPLGI